MRRLGIDPGSARTGVAVADDELGVATPLCTVQHASVIEAAIAIARIVDREEIGETVVGLPLALDGREGEAARRARRFAHELGQRSAVPVVFWDERLSTVSAERALREQGVRGAARRQVIDQAAATMLLQSYMDRQRARTWHSDSNDSIQDHPTTTTAPTTPRTTSADAHKARRRRDVPD